MSLVMRIRAWPRLAATGAAVAVYLAGGNNDAPHYDGQHYMAGVIADPRFEVSVSFNDEGWAARAVPQSGPIGWMPAEPERLDPLAAYYWRDAAIEIDRIKDGVTTRRLTGTIAEATISDGRLVITCADLSNRLDKPFVTATFAGTGGIEGGDFAIGRVKRRSFGKVWNVEGRLLDKANSIYEFGDPAFPLQGCTALRDKGRAGSLAILGWQGSIAATFTALQASAPAQGGGVFAPSIACAKWWTQPSGPLTADLQGEAAGYAETPAGIAAQLLAAASGPSISNLAAASALRPGVAGIHIADTSETTAAALDRLFQRVTLIWVLTPTGDIEVRPWTFTAPVEALNAIFISRERTVQPVKTRRVGYKKNERQHGDGEISIAVQADDVLYADGTPVEDLKPAEPGATAGASPAQVDQIAQLEVDTAAAQAAISSAQAAIAVAQGEIDAAQAEIDGAVANIAAHGSAISTIEDAVAAQETAVSLIGNELSVQGSALATVRDKIGVLSAADEAAAGSLLAATIKASDQSASFSSERTLRTNSEEAIARSVDAIGVRMGTAEANITSEATVRATADTALTNQLNALTSTVNGNTAAISSEASTRATADTALSNSINSLTTTVNGNTAAISSEASTRATADTALSNSIDSLTTTVNGNTAAITSEASTRSTADTALSNSINSLTVTVNGHTTSISTNASAIATANGNITTLFARYALKLDVNGYVTGWELNNNGSSGNFIVYSDRFAIQGAGGGSQVYPFEVVSGVTYIKAASIRDATITSAKITDLTIGTVKIDPSAISNVSTGASSGNISIPEAGGYYQLAEVAFPAGVSAARYVLFLISWLVKRQSNLSGADTAGYFIDFFKVDAANAAAYHTYRDANGGKITGTATAVSMNRRQFWQGGASLGDASMLKAGCEVFFDATPVEGDLIVLGMQVGSDTSSGSSSPVYREVEMLTDVRWR